MKITLFGIEFGKKWLNPECQHLGHPYYIYWFDWIDDKENRKWGGDRFFYDGPHQWFCFWYFCVGYHTPWMDWNKK